MEILAYLSLTPLAVACHRSFADASRLMKTSTAKLVQTIHTVMCTRHVYYGTICPHSPSRTNDLGSSRSSVELSFEVCAHTSSVTVLGDVYIRNKDYNGPEGDATHCTIISELLACTANGVVGLEQPTPDAADESRAAQEIACSFAFKKQQSIASKVGRH